MKKIIIFLLSILLFSCAKTIINPKDYAYKEPQILNDGLKIKNITTTSINSDLIQKMTNDLINEELHNLHSVLIFKDNALVYEKYLNGKDQKHGKNLGIIEHDINSLHDVRSISKSVVSACVGVAIKKGLIHSVDDPISMYFSEIGRTNSNDERLKITIKDLLTMSSGFSWKEIGNYKNLLLNDETRMDISYNPIKFVLNKKVVNEPGTIWNYSAGNTQLLAEIIKRKSGQNIEQFAQENIFSPLQITTSEWIGLTITNEKAAASGLRLTSRSLLKLGIMYKDFGRFNAKQIIDSIWTETSTFPHIKRPPLNQLNIQDGSYGFNFWLYDFKINDKNVKIMEAKGNGGQSIFICKELDLVVVITAGNYSKVKYNDLPYKIVSSYILPSLFTPGRLTKQKN
ncbi:serine hydrolase domain-containing protein [Flavobacterium soyangense]|uniref:Serine hydrolase n=1 Tax=Flavobacterium soyangense TaxID=2023265 RepID=A0A930XYI5_9FLAO|nr:serine hydrolase [Flavobacterium soyangense]MBF2707868.1 serine hydrolase [Flavobacterium soyangense]